jgi:hypothetical protein
VFPCSERSPNSAAPRWKASWSVPNRGPPGPGYPCAPDFGVLAAFRFFFIMGLSAVIPSLVGVWVILVGDLILLMVLLGEAYEKRDHSVEGLLG